MYKTASDHVKHHPSGMHPALAPEPDLEADFVNDKDVDSRYPKG